MAELTSVSCKKGHYYLELVEHTAEGQLLAKADAVIWKNNTGIVTEFEKATGEALSVGQSILFETRIAFSERYGLRLELLGLSSEYTLGDLLQQKKRVLKQLEEQGLQQKQAAWPAPFDYFRIAVVAPEAAAGLEDFNKLLQPLTEKGLLDVQRYHATFEGDQLETSITQAMRLVWQAHRESPFDAMILVRGGGSSASLKQLDNFTLAHAIAVFCCPVYVGIGHERDQTVLDQVANHSFPTPSAVASHIVETVTRNATQVERCFQTVQHSSMRLMSARKEQLSRSRAELQAGTHTAVNRYAQKSGLLWNPIRERVLGAVNIQRQAVSSQRSQIQSRCERQIELRRKYAQRFMEDLAARKDARVQQWHENQTHRKSRQVMSVVIIILVGFLLALVAALLSR